MSLGLGEGGEQNAPLGRAVIGGLIMATLFTLLFVPVVYSVLRRRDKINDIDPLLFEPDEYALTDADQLSDRTPAVVSTNGKGFAGTNGHAHDLSRSKPVPDRKP
jgi:hypothetical protein